MCSNMLGWRLGASLAPGMRTLKSGYRRKCWPFYRESQSSGGGDAPQGDGAGSECRQAQGSRQVGQVSVEQKGLSRLPDRAITRLADCDGDHRRCRSVSAPIKWPRKLWAFIIRLYRHRPPGDPANFVDALGPGVQPHRMVNGFRGHRERKKALWSLCRYPHQGDRLLCGEQASRNVYGLSPKGREFGERSGRIRHAEEPGCQAWGNPAVDPSDRITAPRPFPACVENIGWSAAEPWPPSNRATPLTTNISLERDSKAA